MAFDLKNAKPVGEEPKAPSKFNVAAAKPVEGAAAAVANTATEEAPPAALPPRTFRTAMNETRGVGKAAAQMAGSLPATVLSGLDGLSAMAGNLIFSKKVDPAARVKGTQAALSLPQGDSVSENLISGAASIPGTVITKGADKAGDVAMDVTGSPAVATGVKTAIEGVGAMALPAVARPVGRAVKSVVGGKPQPMPKQTPATGKMSDEQMRAAHVQTLLANDIPVPFSQRGKGTLNKQAASVARASDTVLGPSKLLDEQGSAFTSAVLKKVRVDAKRATPDVMNEVKGRIDQQYNDLLSRPTRIDDQLVKELVDAQDQIKRELNDGDAAPLLRQIEDIVRKAEQHKASPGPDLDLIDGRAQQSSRASLNRMTQSQNPSIQHWAGELKEILDNGYERSAAPADVTAMKQVRADVQKVKQFENAIGPDGVVSPHKLWQNLNRKNNKGQLIYARGDQSLVELTRAAKEVLSEKLGNSGTVPRGMDIEKIRSVIRHPVQALAEGTALASGRFAESGAAKGTVSDVMRQRLQVPQAAPNLRSAVPGAAVVSQPAVETEEQRRRRLQAEALRQ